MKKTVKQFSASIIALAALASMPTMASNEKPSAARMGQIAAQAVVCAKQYEFINNKERSDKFTAFYEKALATMETDYQAGSVEEKESLKSLKATLDASIEYLGSDELTTYCDNYGI